MSLVAFALLLSAGCEPDRPAEVRTPGPSPEVPGARPRGETAAPPSSPGLVTLGTLRARVRGAPTGPVIVLLHGFGAPGDDLVPVADYLAARLETPARFVLPEAPLPQGAGRAWWRLDLDELERARAEGRVRDLSGDVPAGLAEARQAVLALLAAVRERFGVSASEVVLGGFSQGAMLAMDVMLRAEEPPAAVFAMSGALLAAREWVPRMEARSGVPVFVSHGREDPLLPFQASEALRDRLEVAGAHVTFVAFDGGHQIPPPVLEAVADFLATTLSGGTLPP